MIRSCVLPLQSMEKVNIDLCQSNNQLTKERRGQVRLEPYPSYSLSELVIILLVRQVVLEVLAFSEIVEKGVVVLMKGTVIYFQCNTT